MTGIKIRKIVPGSVTWISHQAVTAQKTNPQIKKSKNVFFFEAFSAAKNMGTKANQAKNSRLNLGKDKAKRIADKTDKSKLLQLLKQQF